MGTVVQFIGLRNLSDVEKDDVRANAIALALLKLTQGVNLMLGLNMVGRTATEITSTTAKIECILKHSFRGHDLLRVFKWLLLQTRTSIISDLQDKQMINLNREVEDLLFKALDKETSREASWEMLEQYEKRCTELECVAEQQIEETLFSEEL